MSDWNPGRGAWASRGKSPRARAARRGIVGRVRWAAPAPMLALALAGPWLSLFACAARGEAPTVTSLFPAGGARGTTVEVTAAGKFEPWPARARVEIPGGIEDAEGEGSDSDSDSEPALKVEALEEKGKFRVTIRGDAPLGRYGIRFWNEDGATEARAFLVGALPERLETEPNDRLGEATAIDLSSEAPGVSIWGRLSERRGDVDGYRVRLKAGATLVASVSAREALGSPMDGVLQIADDRGFVLFQNDDDRGMDPLLAFRAPRDGEYVARLFAFPATPDSSIRFSSGEDHVYRLTLTIGPHADRVAPLVSGSDAGSARVFGWNLSEGAGEDSLSGAGLEAGLAMAPEVPLTMEDGPEIRGFARLSGSVAMAGEAASELIAIGEPGGILAPDDGVGGGSEVLTLSVPGEATGRLSRARERDVFAFEGKGGEALSIRVRARAFHSLADPFVRVLNPDGSILAEQDDPGGRREGTRDPNLSATPKADGTHRLVVGDVFGQGSPRHWYHVSIRPGAGPGSIAATGGASAIKVEAGKPATLTFRGRRGGWPADAKVEVTVAGVPEDLVRVTPGVLEKDGDVTVKLERRGDAPADARFSGPFRALARIRFGGEGEGGTVEERIVPRGSETPGAERGFAYWLTVGPGGK